ncbi:hypothetical protein [Edwardsiella ictaluri]|uniref:hypothetical protein n=1 Tax=Edwardsiella ictaluri TaxID=67780 RepID=UPI001E352007|nr:hypothetical protein [Edwardsiella ictaluri]
MNDELFRPVLLLVNDGPTLEVSTTSRRTPGRSRLYGNAWMGELGVTVPLGDIVSLSGLTGYADREFLGTLGADIRSSNLTLSLLQTLGSQGYQKSDLVATYYPLSLQYTRERYRQRERPFVRTLPGAVEPDDVLQPSLIPDYLDQHPGMSANRENLLANYSVALHQDHTLQLGYQFFREQSQRSQYAVAVRRLPWNINLTASLNYARNDLWSASVGLSVPIGSLQASSYYSQQTRVAGAARTPEPRQSLAEAWLVNLQGGQQFSDSGADHLLGRCAPGQRGCPCAGLSGQRSVGWCRQPRCAVQPADRLRRDIVPAAGCAEPTGVSAPAGRGERGGVGGAERAAG